MTSTDNNIFKLVDLSDIDENTDVSKGLTRDGAIAIGVCVGFVFLFVSMRFLTNLSVKFSNYLYFCCRKRKSNQSNRISSSTKHSHNETSRTSIKTDVSPITFDRNKHQSEESESQRTEAISDYSDVLEGSVIIVISNSNRDSSRSSI